MAAVVPPADQAAGLLQKLSLDPQTKNLDLPEPTKKASVIQHGSVSSADAAYGQSQPYERSMTPILQDFMDPSICYLPSNTYPYYYGGYEGSANEWEDYPRYVNPDGVEMTPGVYGDNGSIVYPGYGYGPYTPYQPTGSPGPTLGHDGQLYGPQHYQYPPPYFQTFGPTNASFNHSLNAPLKLEVSTSSPSEHGSLPVETSNGNPNRGLLWPNNGSAMAKTMHQNSSFTSNGSYGRGSVPGGFTVSTFQDAGYGYDGVRSPIPWLDGAMFPDMQPRPVTNNPAPSSMSNTNCAISRNQSLHPHTHLMGIHNPRPTSGMDPTHGYLNRMYPEKVYGQCANSYRSGLGVGSNGYDSRISSQGWMGFDNKYKLRGRNNGFSGYYGNENIDGLNELNRGPRAKITKNQKGFVPVALAIKGQNGTVNVAFNEKDKPNAEVGQYNPANFPEIYNDAKFFIIKSYSEDDVHKSIKYDVWASTPNGNKKLDAAFQEALEKPSRCPMFLFFSVNTSGQFVGMAEMVGPVDFHKSMEYWQQDKWNGCFPVKWHFVKDLPNSLLKHIILENNDNKPVTNSRDTQEVKLEQGLQMIKIFKDYSSKTCILDDFSFYEARQKTIEEKKAKQQQFSKQVWEGKAAMEKSQEGANVALDMIRESIPVTQINGDALQAHDNPCSDASENRIVQNGC